MPLCPHPAMIPSAAAATRWLTFTAGSIGTLPHEEAITLLAQSSGRHAPPLPQKRGFLGSPPHAALAVLAEQGAYQHPAQSPSVIFERIPSICRPITRRSQQAARGSSTTSPCRGPRRACYPHRRWTDSSWPLCPRSAHGAASFIRVERPDVPAGSTSLRGAGSRRVNNVVGIRQGARGFDDRLRPPRSPRCSG
jgi:hypothetical protein